MNAGQKTIQWLRRQQLRVDDKWSMNTPKGFKWWPSMNAQTIEIIGSEEGLEGDQGYYVQVKTEVLREFEPSDLARQFLYDYMSAAAMAGPVYEPDRKTLSLASLVRVHDEIWEWMARLLSVAAMLQIQEAKLFSRALAARIGGSPALSGHPANGFRNNPDELVIGFPGILAKMGAESCMWPIHEFNHALHRFMQGPPSLGASGGGRGVTVEFPYGDFSSLCLIDGDKRHSRIGHGLLINQKFPVGNMPDMEGIELALEINLEALDEKPYGYGLGSFGYEDGCVVFNSFIPNLAYKPSLIPNFYFSCAERARYMSEEFTDNDWSEEQFHSASRKSALQRLIELFKS